MYRLFLLIVFISCCSSAPISDSTSGQFVNKASSGDSDVTENSGNGYSFFRNQNIGTRPLTAQLAEIPVQDLSDYLVASAFSEGTPRRRISSMNNDNQEYQDDVQDNWGPRTNSRQNNYRYENTYSTSNRYQPQPQPQQRVFSPQQPNWDNQPTWNQQRYNSQNRPSAPVNQAHGFPQYSFQSYTPPPPQPIYGNGW